MSKITITGNALVITSEMTLEDLLTIKKYRPDALILMGGKDNSEPMFGVDFSRRGGDVSEYGITFDGESHDEKKCACLTLGIPTEIDGDIKEWASDRVGSAVISLNKLEHLLPDVLKEIKEEKEAVMQSISLV